MIEKYQWIKDLNHIDFEREFSYQKQGLTRLVKSLENDVLDVDGHFFLAKERELFRAFELEAKRRGMPLE